jgi:hypothetical protein
MKETNFGNREFKVGDDVIAFEFRKKNQWSQTEIITERGVVVAIRDGWVFVDTCYGPMPYQPTDLEYADVPF